MSIARKSHLPEDNLSQSNLSQSNLSKKKWFWQNNRRQRTRPSRMSKSSLVLSSHVSPSTAASSKYLTSEKSVSKRNQPVSRKFSSRLPQVDLPANFPKSSSGHVSQNFESKSVKKKHRIPIMPASDAFPIWLQYIQKVQRYSSIAVFLLVVSNLIVYGWTVYAQQLWSQNSRKLQRLQRQERQLTTHNETIKNKMAVEAQKPSAGLVSPTPSGAIFLQRTINNRPKSTLNQPSEKVESNQPPPGY